MGLGEVVWGGVNWIDLAQDRDKWRAFVNLPVPYKILGNY
jgi:hypothetical protein